MAIEGLYHRGVFDGIELRHFRYFIVVAEEAHFGRAAERLFIAQPSLSYAIRQLEERLGTVLIDRSNRRELRLTPSGVTFLDHAREVTAHVSDAISATRAAERSGRQLRVGYNDGEPLARRPGALGAALSTLDIDVTFRRLNWGSEGDAVRSGDVDVVLARLPIDTRGLRVKILASEGRSVCLPAHHSLSARQTLTLADLQDLPVVRPFGGTPEWEAFWRGLPRPDGHHPPDGPVTYGPEDTFDTVAAGAAICFVPDSMISTIRTDRLTFIPVTDLIPVQTAIGWSARRRAPRGVTELAGAARRLIGETS